MSNVKTINLTGGETEVIFKQKFMCFWVQNLGSGTVYASLKKGVQPESDGVITIGAGAAARVSAADLAQTDTLYLTGSGKVQIVGTYSVHSPFKSDQKGGGGSSGDYTTIIEIPFKGSFDGYGYEIDGGEYTGGAAIDDDGLHFVPYTSLVVIHPTNPLYQSATKLKFSCDFKLEHNHNPNWNTRTIIFDFGFNNWSSGVGFCQIGTDYECSTWSWGNQFTEFTKTRQKVSDNEWHHVTLLCNLNVDSLIVQIDNNPITFDGVANLFYATNITNQIVIGPDRADYMCEFRLKNFKVEVSEAGEVI
ncbi:MAG: hypothetical protein J1F11_03465 [Oscillospiraceae bacterium]|nr:hypothetical protein [Oscillospiraceae bacterium]